MMAFSQENYKPCLAMVATQCIFTVMNLLTMAAINQGFTDLVFVVCRLSIGFLAVPPLFFARRRGVTGMSLRLNGFCLLFIAALFGGTASKLLLYTGLELGNASLTSVMGNTTPVTTFVMAASVGLEEVELRSLRTWAKIIGTIVCVGGTMILTFYKGQGVINFSNSCKFFGTALHSVGYRWVLAVVCLLGATTCWCLLLIILQAPICKYIDHLQEKLWLCFLSSLQSATIVFFLEPNLSTWKINTVTELLACLFAGVFGSVIIFYLQSWCVSVRGPVYCAKFMPLNTVITVILATITLHEELHIGSLIGTVAIFGGMYTVIWGKEEEVKGEVEEEPTETIDVSEVSISIDGKEDHGEHSTRQPLLVNKQNLEN